MAEQTVHPSVKQWLDEIEAARKREKDFRKTGETILKIYDGSKQESTPFNILFSNTETLLPALYSAVPRPVVQRRFKDDDPLGKLASDAGRRMLEFLLDTNLSDYDPFDTVMRHATLDALLPGRGNAIVKYDADVTGMGEDGEGEASASAEASIPTVQSEMVCLETKLWNRVYYGYAKTWSKVPWVAFEDYIDQAEATRLFGARIAKKMTFTKDDPADAARETSDAREERHTGERKTACIYQIWDRNGKIVRYVSAAYPGGVLKEDDDPLGLSGFFPCPKPLAFVEKTHSLLPTALYTTYENQAIELNKIQLRINRMVEAMKARGIYDSSLGTEIQRVMDADETTLIPSDSSSSLAAEKGMDNAIWFMPLEKIQQALQQLYQARESCKQVIYEITGISDILRGASQASETATAQNIKNQWGTLRLKRLQKEVARYARDLMRIMLELAATKLSEETWAKATGLPFLTTQQAQQVQQLAVIAQATGQPLDPQTQAKLHAPVWGVVLGLLRNDLERAYRIDIETNSTVEPEAAEDQKNIADLMTALGQYLNGVGPLVAKGVMPFEVAQAMMLAISRRFRFGTEIEDYLRQMKPPPPESDGGKGQEAALKQMQQVMMQQVQMKQQEGQNALKMQSMESEKALMEKKIDLELREIQLKADQEKFALAQQTAHDRLAMRDQVHSVKTGAEESVRKVKEQGSQREQQVAKQATGDVKRVTQQVTQLGSALTAIQRQAEQTQALLQEILAVAKAPRVKRPVRGADGKIERVEEEVAV